jgi:hypothetical protein
MAIATYEGVVEKGKIRLMTGVHLPDKTKVYVVVPEMQAKKTAKVTSPHLAHRKQIADFKMEISEEDTDASLRS